MESRGAISKIEEKNRLFKKRFKMMSMMVLGFLILYIPSVLHWAVTKEVIIDMIQSGKIEIFLNAEGYIIRNERLLSSPFSGQYIAEIKEGDKVAVGGTVFTILRDDARDLMNTLNKIDNKIIEIQRGKSENIEVFTKDIKRINDDISAKINFVVDSINKKNISDVKFLKNDIDGLLRRKAIIAAEAESEDEVFLRLKEQRKAIVEKINLNKKEVRAEKAGTVSYFVDGFEKLLNTLDIDAFNFESLKKIKNQAVFSELGEFNSEMKKPVAKIILDDEYVIFVKLDKKYIEQYKGLQKENKRVSIRINDIEKKVKGRIVNISEGKDDFFWIGFEVNKALKETAGLRVVDIDIISKSYEGLKVPINALRKFDEVDKEAELVTIKGGIATFVNVKIKGTNKTFAILERNESYTGSGVTLYDKYIINHHNVKEGQFLNNDSLR